MVLFVSYTGLFGGAERLLLDLARGLPHECAVACPDGPLAQAVTARGLRTFPLPTGELRLRGAVAGRALADLGGYALALRRLVRALEPELVVAWSMRPLLAAVTLHGAAGRPLAFQHNDFLPGPGLGILIRRAAARADLITAPSQAVLDELRLSARSLHRARVVAPGVDLDRFDPDAEPQTPPEILLLGAITAWKRPELAFDVLARVHEALPQVRLRVAGAPLPGDREGEALLGALRARSQAPGLAGAVEVAGALSDPAGALARASLLLHCAEREPFGIAIAEALAAARPAVVPEGAGPAEIVDGDCGRRYPPGDAGAAAAAIVEILSDGDTARALGARGRARAGARFELATQQAAYAAAVAPFLRRAARGRRALARELALVTVTHNSAAHLRTLLASVERHLPGARVVVADCASSDNTVALARERPGTVVLELANLGFGRASNRGLARVAAPVSALVNPDVELIDDSLLELVIEARGRGGERCLLAPRVLNADGSLQDTVHPAPLSGADLARALIPPAALPGRLGVGLAPWRSTAPRPVGWAVGCALVARTDTLRALGPFDERIFLYGEDMELGLRAARGGVATWFWPIARVIHHGGHSIEAAYQGEALQLRAKARHDAIALARGRCSARLDDAAQLTTFATRMALKRALGRPAGRERRQLAALLAIARPQGAPRS
ncbi:MAG: N-acetylglucosaminyl-diphospho-decaprenol L-rhamnosyltransferase [Solirubrobacteraceae bacterium]|nr:N-acetylglucosaminyl-diphospho-decaprenol L-rhamnosyltransferase [Solirubrobacteraceae bacterium]